MRWARCAWAVLGVSFLVLATAATAELESVAVGGEIRIRGNYWLNSFNSGSAPGLVANRVRWGAAPVTGRSMGDLFGDGRVRSHFDWSDDGNDYAVVEQRVRLCLRAEFTEDVAALIELDAFDMWGEDFRSNYVTGVDVAARSDDDIEVFQAYVDMCDVFGVPLRLRLGRQEIEWGDGWLLGANADFPEATGLSFDAIRATYSGDAFEMDAFLGKLAERSPLEQDGDTDLYGLRGMWHATDALDVDLFWLWLRDASSVADTDGPLVVEWMEDLVGVDDYECTNLHTIGLRLSGMAGAFDYDAKAAYQFGDAAHVGALFAPYTYGDDDAEYDAWAADLEAGYTFDAAWRPRWALGAAYVDGEDRRDLSFAEWANPFAPLLPGRASVSFNRLFTSVSYSPIIDEMGELSNFWSVRTGVRVTPTEKVEAGLDVAYFGVLEAFDSPISLRVGPVRVVTRTLVFWTQESGSDIGWQTHLWAKYRWTDDLVISAGWARLFTGDALEDGAFVDLNGLMYNGGTDDCDADYVYVQSTIRF